MTFGLLAIAPHPRAQADVITHRNAVATEATEVAQNGNSGQMLSINLPNRDQR